MVHDILSIIEFSLQMVIKHLIGCHLFFDHPQNLRLLLRAKDKFFQLRNEGLLRALFFFQLEMLVKVREGVGIFFFLIRVRPSGRLRRGALLGLFAWGN
jgi:hypothetical protein